MIKQKLDECVKTNIPLSMQINCGDIFKALKKCKMNVEKINNRL
jgi:hypothetical protein